MKKNITFLILLGFFFTALSLQSFSQLPDSWTQKANVGGAVRYGAVGFSIGTKGYIGTGLTVSTGGKLKDFWEYDPITDTWTQKADFGGTARVAATGFVIGNKGYIGSGDTKKNDFWEYDPITNTWLEKAPFPGTARYGATGFGIGSKGYFGTGIDSVFNRINDFWEFDPNTGASGTWTEKSKIGGATGLPRNFCTSFVIGNTGYVGTGNSDFGKLIEFWAYDPTTDTWTQKQNFGGLARFGAVGFSMGSYGYIGHGDVGAPTIYTNDFWEYIPALDIWIKKANIGGPIRTSSVGFSIGDKAYVGTGADIISGVNYNDFWEYTPTCNEPLITSQPGNQTFIYGLDAEFTVVAFDALSYQWQEDSGTGFANITDGGIYSNATTATLNISKPTVAMSGFKYRCLVSNNCPPAIATNGNAMLTVAPLDITVTPDGAQAKEYGAADPAPFTYTFAPPLSGTDAITGLLSRTAGEDVGSYIYTIGSLTAGSNYNLSVAAAPVFDITAKALTITADDKEKCFDGAIYGDAYTVKYSGFANTEDQSVLSGTLVFGGTSATGVIAGNYTIIPSGLTSSNYTVGFVNGILVIKTTPSAAIITRSGDSLISSVANGNQWYLDGVAIPGSNGDVHVATANGAYYTIITESGCSSAASNSISVIDVSIREVSTEQFDIYPNPNNGVFNIKVKTASNAIYNIEIYNSIGNLVWKQNNADINGNNIKTINLNDHKSGLYTIVLKNKANSFAKKVFITK